MQRLSRSIQIASTRTEIFEFLDDPHRLVMVWPSMLDVKNITTSPKGGRSYDWTYKMAGIHFHGHTDTVKYEPGRLLEVKTTGGIKCTVRWSLDGEDGSTILKADFDYEIPTPVLGKIAEAIMVKMNERELETLLFNIQTQLAGARAAEAAKVRSESIPRH